MGALEAIWFTQRAGIRAPERNPDLDLAPPGGISFCEASHMIASGRATLGPVGVHIITTEGVHYRKREGHHGLWREDAEQ